MFIQFQRRVTLIAILSCVTAISNIAHAEEFPRVNIKTSVGDIVLELYPEKAPKTVENFLRYVKKGHYNKTIFHRVIDNFMIQGGGLDVSMREKPTDKPVVSEAKIAFEHELKNDIGTIAMARTNDPNSARAQFYINVNNNDFLNYQALPEGDPVQIMKNGEPISLPRARALIFAAGYTPFGKVIEGWDVVEKIKTSATSEVSIYQNVPVKPVIILSIKLVK
ncbi:peptidylprolyl isomerase [Undibacterium fentianense]|uniref:Peptidyl-prolyl cis-trans isomerase n=1 Tax=Undibacterium fentianense TaxID=2828728 RepID=A0A941DY04_9BURK|nr:peptidylprolyl isomerase [Undibacterium fentianense]MBR7798820.1 peptidylprolyl isomerase [Undibacterium fentianense]